MAATDPFPNLAKPMFQQPIPARNGLWYETAQGSANALWWILGGNRRIQEAVQEIEP